MKNENTNVHSEYTASSKANLLCYLKQQDITVLPRTEGRTSQQCERWGVFRLLATWANANYLSYPLRFVHRDKPDFLILYNDREVGIEFTEAVSQEMAETRALAKQMRVKATLPMDQFRMGTPKRTKAKRRSIIQDQPCGEGWADDEPEREWAQWMMDRVLAKTEGFNKPCFKKCDENWLLIYDNLPLQFEQSENIQDATEYLMVKLNSYWHQNNRYDGVIIDTGNQLVTIYLRKQPIVNLWARE